MTLFGDFRLEQPQVMVSCKGVRRLFVLDVGVGGSNYAICRIDPDSGRIELRWLVDGSSCKAQKVVENALTVAGNDHLLFTKEDRVEQYNAEGQLICVIPTGMDQRYRLQTSLLRKRYRFERSTMLPDSTSCS